jgi:hypothetical protein
MQTRLKNRTVSMRLSTVGGELLDELARRRGISRTALVETMLRDQAEAKGIVAPSERVARQAQPMPQGYSEEWTEEDMRDAAAMSLRHANDQFDAGERPNG